MVDGNLQAGGPDGQEKLPALIRKNRARRIAHQESCDGWEDRKFKGDRTYRQLCRELSGQMVPDIAQWEKGNALDLNLRQQTLEIANRMESAGFSVRSGRDLALVGLHSRNVRQLEDFRDLRILPTVARRKRRNLQKYVERFAEMHPYCRMWTFTTGDRVPVWELRERLRWLHRKVSKLNAQEFMQANGLRVEARFSELGEIVTCEGRPPLYHPHAHLLVSTSCRLSAEAWGGLLDSVHEWWGQWWNEGGRVRDARELVKYCAKPGDLLKLDGRELVLLQDVMSKARLVETLGTIRKERKHHKDQGLRIDRISGNWRTVHRWNVGTDPRTLGRSCGAAVPPTLRLLARCIPAPIFMPVSEPIFLVENLRTASIDDVLALPEAKQVRAELYGSHLGPNCPEEKNEKAQKRPNEFANAPPPT